MSCQFCFSLLYRSGIPKYLGSLKREAKMKIFLFLIIALSPLFSFAQVESVPEPQNIVWDDGSSCSQANKREVENSISNSTKKARNLLRDLSSAAQAWAEDKEGVSGVIVQSITNLAPAPILHLLEGGADGLTIITENAHRFLGYSFDSVKCFAANISSKDVENASPEVQAALVESKSAVNCILEYAGTVTSLLFLSGGELIQSLAGTVNKILGDVSLAIQIPLEAASDYFLDMDSRFANTLGDAFYFIGTVINGVEVLISGTLSAAVMLINTGIEVISHVICGTTKALTSFIQTLKNGKSLGEAFKAMGSAFKEAGMNTVYAAHRGWERFIQIIKDMFRKAGFKHNPTGFSEDVLLRNEH